MKKIVEISFEQAGETRGYYIFNVMVEEDHPTMHPKKIYLKKELFKKKPKIIQVTITEKEVLK